VGIVRCDDTVPHLPTPTPDHKGEGRCLLHCPGLERVPVMLSHFSGVMAGLVPAIHACWLTPGKKNVDARDKRGHDGGEVVRFHRNVL
jgi:hypothetical protein